MMELALGRCFAAPAVEAVVIDPLASNVRARRFYERLGFIAVERRTFGSDDCIVYRLSREGWLAARSPSRQPGSSDRAERRQNGNGKAVPDGDEER